MATLSVEARNAALDAVIAMAESPVGALRPDTIAIFNAGVSLLGFAAVFPPPSGWAPASGGSKALALPLIFAMSGSGTVNGVQLSGRNGAIYLTISTVGGPGSGLEVEFSPDAAVVAGEIYQVNELTFEVA